MLHERARGPIATVVKTRTIAAARNSPFVPPLIAARRDATLPYGVGQRLLKAGSRRSSTPALAAWRYDA